MARKRKIEKRGAEKKQCGKDLGGKGGLQLWYTRGSEELRR